MPYGHCGSRMRSLLMIPQETHGHAMSNTKALPPPVLAQTACERYAAPSAMAKRPVPQRTELHCCSCYTSNPEKFAPGADPQTVTQCAECQLDDLQEKLARRLANGE